MMRSTTQLAEPLACHPVHRANAMLRQALLNFSTPAPDPAEVWDNRMFRLEPQPIELAYGPLGITAPDSFDALHNVVLNESPGSDCQSLVTDAADGSAARPSPEDAAEGYDMLDYAVQQQLQAMVHAFHRRQRQASLIVAGSIIAALVLTLGGLILLFSMTDTVADGRGGAVPAETSSNAQVHNGTGLGLPVRVQANSAAKTAALLIHAKSEIGTPSSGEAETRVILALPGRSLALGPLLPVGSARYLLLRGLPEESRLSAGRRTGPGAWLVKDEDVAGLTLTLGGNAGDDYPAEAYLLGTEGGPQARRRFILRIDPAAQRSARDPQAAAGPNSDLANAHERARVLLGQGNIVTARRLLTELAERGLAAAAYELALTYDQEVLAKAGLDGVQGNMDIAQAWYAHAAQQGHAGAAQRLRTFARRRTGA